MSTNELSQTRSSRQSGPMAARGDVLDDLIIYYAPYAILMFQV